MKFPKEKKKLFNCVRSLNINRSLNIVQFKNHVNKFNFLSSYHIIAPSVDNHLTYHIIIEYVIVHIYTQTHARFCRLMF